MSNLKPTNDFVFKKLFGEEKNVDILKDLIRSILPELQIAKVVVNKDVSLERKLITDKLGILDVMATLNDNTKINIEMQVEDLHNTIERSIFYQSGVYHESLAKGVSYINAFKTIGIWITNYDVDFDGTIVTHEYPKIGTELPFATETLKTLIRDHHKLILWKWFHRSTISWFA